MAEPARQRKDFLEPLTSTPKRKPFVTFDIESKKNDTQEAGFTRPFMVGFYDGSEFKAFFNDQSVEKLPWHERAVARGGCIDKFMRHLLGQRDDGTYDFRYRNHDVYAHNLGGFDGLFLPAWLEKNRRWTSYKIVPIQGRIQTAELWRYSPSRPRRTREERRRADSQDRKIGVVRFLDSFRVMPIKLDAVIKMFKLRPDGQGKDEFDLNTPEWEQEAWKGYNRVDTVELWQAMNKYQHLIVEVMGGEVGITAPSTAVKLLRRKYMGEESKIHRNIHFAECPREGCDGCAHEFFRSAYFGGRTEVYQFHGEGYYYDVNSSYPFSMKKPMPIGEMEVTGENEDFSKYTRGNHVGFVRCTVHVPEDVYLPPLPVPHGGKLKFPVGTFSGTWDWAELASLGRIGGRILHVEKAVWIRARKFLGNFVDSLYAMRNKKSNDYDVGRSETAKIMMNSTFGKFGMEQDRLELVILKPGEEEPALSRLPGESVRSWAKRKEAEQGVLTGRKRQGGNLKSQGRTGDLRLPELTMPSSAYEHDSLIRIRDIRVDAPYIIPQIAAHITALSRNLLWSFAMDILDRGGKIFYGDTDSILTDYNGIPDSTELGGLKKEFDGERIKITCYGPKTYVLEKETPFSGTHIQAESSEGKAGRKMCLETCPGCRKGPDGKIVSSEHEASLDGQKLCEKKCPGCSTYKVMMKGVPKDLRTRNTLDRMSAGEEVTFQLHEKLGALARAAFRRTPRMVDVKKSFKSKYDKRTVAADGVDTLPIILRERDHISASYLEAISSLRETQPWMENVLAS